jgi:hypothetical protein
MNLRPALRAQFASGLVDSPVNTGVFELILGEVEI